MQPFGSYPVGLSIFLSDIDVSILGMGVDDDSTNQRRLSIEGPVRSPSSSITRKKEVISKVLDLTDEVTVTVSSNQKNIKVESGGKDSYSSRVRVSSKLPPSLEVIDDSGDDVEVICWTLDTTSTTNATTPFSINKTPDITVFSADQIPNPLNRNSCFATGCISNDIGEDAEMKEAIDGQLSIAPATTDLKTASLALPENEHPIDVTPSGSSSDFKDSAMPIITTVLDTASAVKGNGMEVDKSYDTSITSQKSIVENDTDILCCENDKNLESTSPGSHVQLEVGIFNTSKNDTTPKISRSHTTCIDVSKNLTSNATGETQILSESASNVADISLNDMRRDGGGVKDVVEILDEYVTDLNRPEKRVGVEGEGDEKGDGDKVGEEGEEGEDSAYLGQDAFDDFDGKDDYSGSEGSVENSDDDSGSDNDSLLIDEGEDDFFDDDDGGGSMSGRKRMKYSKNVHSKSKKRKACVSVDLDKSINAVQANPSCE